MASGVAGLSGGNGEYGSGTGSAGGAKDMWIEGSGEVGTASDIEEIQGGQHRWEVAQK